VILDPDRDLHKTVTIVSRTALDRMLEAPPTPEAPFKNEVERRIADATLKAIQKYESLPSSTRLLAEEVQRKIVQDVSEAIAPEQLELEGVAEKPDVAAVVRKMTSFIVDQGIDIPRIVVVPKGEVTVGYRPFKLDVSTIRYQPVERDLLIQHLRTREQETISFGPGTHYEVRLEDYVVRGLIDFDDVSYDEHADLLYDLAGQVVTHLRSYLSEDDTRNVLIYHQKQIAAFVHAQMQANQWEKVADYDVKVTKGFTKLKESACTAKAGEPVHDFRQTVEDRSRVPQMLFGGFQRCLVEPVKFQSDTERRLAIVLDRESGKWFRPAKGQFQIFYKSGPDHAEYQPDFVAETKDCIYMLESKARNELGDADVLAKKEAAVKWCSLATTHTTANGGKAWKYMLIPHDTISENMTLGGLASQFLAKG